ISLTRYRTAWRGRWSPPVVLVRVETAILAAVGPSAFGGAVVAVAVVFAVLVAGWRVRQPVRVDLRQFRTWMRIGAVRRAVLADREGGCGRKGQGRQGGGQSHAANNGNHGALHQWPRDCGVGGGLDDETELPLNSSVRLAAPIAATR